MIYFMDNLNQRQIKYSITNYYKLTIYINLVTLFQYVQFCIYSLILGISACVESGVFKNNPEKLIESDMVFTRGESKKLENSLCIKNWKILDNVLSTDIASGLLGFN